MGIDIDEVRLIFGEGGVFLNAIDLSEEGMGVIAVKMQERELCARAANVKLGRAIVKARTQNARKGAIEPVRKEIGRLRVDVGEQLRQEVRNNGIADVGSGMFGAGRINAVDEIGQVVLLAIDAEIFGSEGELEI